jgi:hypothetical protein
VPTPPKKKANKLAIGCIGAIVLVIILVIVAAAGGGHSSTTSSNTNATTTGGNATTAPTKATTWQTTHTYTGSGSKKTETFTVGKAWKIGWSCTPGSFAGIDSYNVIVSVQKSGSDIPLDYGAINTLCKDGNASGETEEHKGGTVYLDIASEGDWTITIQELK